MSLTAAIESSLEEISEAVERAQTIRLVLTRAGIPWDKRTLTALVAIQEALEGALLDNAE